MTPGQATTPPPTPELVRSVLAGVCDPEIPVITIEDLGILRGVEVDGGTVIVTITPTYSGCPAMEEITSDVRAALAAQGWADVEVRMVLSPAWTTEWMTEDGRQKLLAYGIAPPTRRTGDPVLVQLAVPSQLAPATIVCPQCGSDRTQELTRFGSTACKSMWRCTRCREPFDHFRDH